MATVYLPLSSFSRKILLAEYGNAEPVTPGRADWLSDMLRIDRSDTRFAEDVTSRIASGIYLNVPPPLADRITQQGLRLGVVLHRNHIEQLTRYMLAGTMGITNAKSAMRAFYDHYGIEDDDMDEQSVYREFSRFKRIFFRTKPAISATKSRGRVLPDSRIWQGVSATPNRISTAELAQICEHFDERLAASRIRRVERLSEQAHIYIWHVRSGRNVPVIAKHFQKHRASVYRAIAAMRRRIRRDRRFAEAILPVLDASFVLPKAAELGHLCPETPVAVPA